LWNGYLSVHEIGIPNAFVIPIACVIPSAIYIKIFSKDQIIAGSNHAAKKNVHAKHYSLCSFEMVVGMDYSLFVWEHIGQKQ
tara:strand:+ start:255 stop:500 length:246 start_codon:yes stop_codon:yes gene_type:complete